MDDHPLYFRNVEQIAQQICRKTARICNCGRKLAGVLYYRVVHLCLPSGTSSQGHISGSEPGRKWVSNSNYNGTWRCQGSDVKGGEEYIGIPLPEAPWQDNLLPHQTKSNVMRYRSDIERDIPGHPLPQTSNHICWRED